MTSSMMKIVLRKAIEYLQTPKGKKEFKENRENSLFLQKIIKQAEKEIIQEINHKGYSYEYSDIVNEKDILVDVWCIPRVDWDKLKKRHLSTFQKEKRHNSSFIQDCFDNSCSNHLRNDTCQDGNKECMCRQRSPK